MLNIWKNGISRVKPLAEVGENQSCVMIKEAGAPKRLKN